MSTLFIIVNHKKKQYYDLDKFEGLEKFTLEEIEEAVKDFDDRIDNKWYARFVYEGFKVLLPDVEIVTDMEDRYFDIEDTYELIGTRFPADEVNKNNPLLIQPTA